jgi:peptidylprolyl isomerase
MNKILALAGLMAMTSVAFAQQAKPKPKPKQQPKKTTAAPEKSKEPQNKLNVEYTTASGLKYKIIEKGTGTKAVPGSTVAVHYVGTLQDGTKFDSSRDRGQPYSFPLGAGRVIKGWDEVIALLQVGDIAILTIPPSLGYGPNAMGPIPANSTLIFEVELMDVKEPVKPWTLTKAYDTVTTASGLKYIVVEKSTNPDAVKAENGKTVEVHYTGFLKDGKVFDSSISRGQPISFPLGQGMVIKGWEEGIALMHVGDKLRLIIPSDLGYGAAGAGGGSIPPNSTLFFDVELMGVR